MLCTEILMRYPKLDLHSLGFYFCIFIESQQPCKCSAPVRCRGIGDPCLPLLEHAKCHFNLNQTHKLSPTDSSRFCIFLLKCTHISSVFFYCGFSGIFQGGLQWTSIQIMICMLWGIWICLGYNSGNSMAQFPVCFCSCFLKLEWDPKSNP